MQGKHSTNFTIAAPFPAIFYPETEAGEVVCLHGGGLQGSGPLSASS